MLYFFDMYGYFDESILYLNGKKYLFLGFIVYRENCLDSVIKRELIKVNSPLRNRPEFKFSDAKEDKLKERILDKVKKSCLYFDSSFMEIKSNADIHMIVNKLIEKILAKYSTSIQNKNDLRILYDKVSYKINLEEIFENFSFVRSFEMKDSRRHFGLQNADWIVGDAARNFRINQ